MTNTKPTVTKRSAAPSPTADQGKIVLGAGYRLPSQPAHVADNGKIRLGAGYRLPVTR